MLTEALSFHAAQISLLLNIAGTHVEQLVLVSGGGWEIRTELLHEVASKLNLKYTAIGLPIAKELLDQSPNHRPLYVSEMIGKLVEETNQGLALDHIEVLFEPELHNDPLRFIRSMSHGRLILLSWPGKCESSRLTYAEPDHPEYHVYSAGDTLVYTLEDIA